MKILIGEVIVPGRRLARLYSLCKSIYRGYNQRGHMRHEIEKHVPLPHATFHILMAVSDVDRHGYAIIQEVAARTNGQIKLSAGTLYRSIQRMLEQGLIVETSERPAPELDDERRRYYRITPLGTAVARAETTRLSNLVRLARVHGFVPEKA